MPLGDRDRATSRAGSANLLLEALFESTGWLLLLHSARSGGGAFPHRCRSGLRDEYERHQANE